MDVIHSFAELVIFDDYSDRRAAEIAKAAALEANWEPELFFNADQAVRVTGLLTRGIITAEPKGFFSKKRTPYQVSKLIGIPMAVLVGPGSYPEGLIGDDPRDIVIPRSDLSQVALHVSRWLEAIGPAPDTISA